MKKIDWLLNLMIVVAAVLLVLSIASLAGKIMRSQAEDEEVREIMAEAQVRIDDYSASKPAQEKPVPLEPVEPVTVADLDNPPSGLRPATPFQKGALETVEDWYIESVPLSKQMQKVAFNAAADNGVDYLLVLAVIGTESCYDSSAVSPSGCYGYMQLNPRYFPADLTDEENIRDGTAYLADCMVWYEGDVPAALCAYNDGHDTGNRDFANAVLAARAEIMATAGVVEK